MLQNWKYNVEHALKYRTDDRVLTELVFSDSAKSEWTRIQSDELDEENKEEEI